MRDRHLWFAQALLPGGWARDVRLALDAEGAIAGIDAGQPPGPEDERGGIALPGLGNLHGHAFQRGMAGLAEWRGAAAHDDFWTWRETMYGFLAHLDPEDVQAIAALAYAEMLESGFTRAGEFHYLHHAPGGTRYAEPAIMASALVEAARETGIALTLLPAFYAQGGFGGAPPSPGQMRFVTTPDEFATLHAASVRAVAALPDGRAGLAPHSLRAVAPADLARIVALDPAAPVHIHAAEQTREVEDCLAALGARPVQWLLEEAGAGPRWCLIHATHLTPDEARALAASGAVAGLCPVTEANLGDGVFPAAGYLAAGGGLGVGSDSHIRIDLAEELRALEYAQRLTRRERTVLASPARPSCGATLFHAALAGGAQALHGTTGLSAGTAADLVSLREDSEFLAGRSGDAVLDAFVFAGGRALIDRVWRRGRLVVQDGRHRARPSIVARYRDRLSRLVSRMN